MSVHGETPQVAERGTTFLGRPAVVWTLGTSSGSKSGEGGERSHKRSRPTDAGGAGGADGAPGGVQQVARSMLRAHRLGVLVPIIYSADPATGTAVAEAVPGRRLAELMAEAAGAVPGTQAEEPSTAEPGKAAEAGGEAGAQEARAEAGGIPATAAEPAGAAAAATAPADAPAATGPSGKQAAAADLPPELSRAAAALGRSLASLHDGGQVHGALSGRAVLLREGDGAVVLTDFRRSYNSIVPLDKASDLAGLQAALAEEATAGAGAGSTAAAALAAQVYDALLATYRASSRYWSAVHNKIPEARAALARSQQAHATKRPRAEEPAANTTDAATGAPAAT
ncbi:hypothetical protein GPECTOR_4g608 [Gonium pectorale]|uniref:non-specific serine/threonine protein kinase n=1 Tax=Gonium pectorale TaxID=33097 RepID=A0A150GXR3_GONPE|nr:hypothetical protein GPECTOR_4g608 [Gonium pectorale]|eukprot:KXZ54543.1 hypothetical protein GPECTOR_4g608 [Gonium pectorale]